MIDRLLTRPCTIRRTSPGASTDEYGTPVADEVETETRCALQQRQRTENDDAISDTGWLLVLPAGTDIDTSDVVEVDGDAYEVVGDPWRVVNELTTVEDHVEATVQRTAGSEDA